MSNNITARIAALPGMTVPQLKKLWQELHATEPPPFNKPYFVKRLAYCMQELAYGTDGKTLERRLETYARQHMDLQSKSIKKASAVSSDKPVAGTHLMCEHNGEMHEVTVLHYGFDYRGKRYKSPSSIARAITGTQWSGPLFFGLKHQTGGRT